MLGGSANVTQMYEGRVQTHPNGSLTITDLHLQDSGYYTITVTEASGNSRDMCMVLSVTGERVAFDIETQIPTEHNALFNLSCVSEVVYEDIQYFIVFIVVLGTLAAFLMLCMWLLNKLHNFIKAWRQRRCLPGIKLH